MLSGTRISNDKLILEFISNEDPISIRRLVEVPIKNVGSISKLSDYGSVKDYKLSVSKLQMRTNNHTYIDNDGCLIFELHNISRALILELNNSAHPAIIFEVSNPEAFISMLNIRLNRQKRKSA